uniref:Uncharacterized protein n=1 Tax=Romanomermis culicivorax TaxID=13658 RepID=A0A915HUI4_ROMCU
MNKLMDLLEYIDLLDEKHDYKKLIDPNQDQHLDTLLRCFACENVVGVMTTPILNVCIVSVPKKPVTKPVTLPKNEKIEFKQFLTGQTLNFLDFGAFYEYIGSGSNNMDNFESHCGPGNPIHL